MKNLDWAKLPFGYIPTDYNVRCYYRDGKWGEIEVCSDEYIKDAHGCYVSSLRSGSI